MDRRARDADDGHGAGAHQGGFGRDGHVGHAQLLAGDHAGAHAHAHDHAQGGPGATLATLDTTVLSNGTYVIDLDGTDDHGNQQDNEVLVTVAGDYKPGRVVVDFPEFTVPVAGSRSRRAALRQPRAREGRRLRQRLVTGGRPSGPAGRPGQQRHHHDAERPPGDVHFEIQPEAVGAIVLGFIAQPIYVPEPGVFGTLTSDGCNLLAFDPTQHRSDLLRQPLRSRRRSTTRRRPTSTPTPTASCTRWAPTGR